MRKNKKNILIILVLLLSIILLGSLIPSIRERAAWHFDKWQIRAEYFFNPPSEVVFVPQSTSDTPPQATKIHTAALTSTPADQANMATPTMTPTQLPSRVLLEGFTYATQHGFWNFCAPANLYMNLSYWGWEGDIVEMGKELKPYEKDKNVMAYEMADYVNAQTPYKATLRHGGTPEILKTLVANGFPALVEIGTFRIRDIDGNYSWMGHYNVVSGYDDEKQVFIVQDSYFEPGVNYEIPYETIIKEWRSFNFVFIVIYTPEKEELLNPLLGEYLDDNSANAIALSIANEEIEDLTGVDQFFAWFNKGTSLIRIFDYFGAADAYDQAFFQYAEIDKKNRPWRMMWYQTGPYFAYYYTNRYLDVIELATNTIDTASQPYLEESFYWRAQAHIALGNLDQALADLRKSLEYHPGFPPSVEALRQLGYEE